jgi:hypothetical protein
MDALLHSRMFPGYSTGSIPLVSTLLSVKADSENVGVHILGATQEASKDKIAVLVCGSIDDYHEEKEPGRQVV